MGDLLPTAEVTRQERTSGDRTLYVGERGRIWVHRHVPALPVDTEPEPRPDRPPPLGWREPTVFDVFAADGTYLGEVHVPDLTDVQVFRGDTLWGIRRGDPDEQYVVRLRVEHSPRPQSGAP
jgi:hypothetical protein